MIYIYIERERERERDVDHKNSDIITRGTVKSYLTNKMHIIKCTIIIDSVWPGIQQIGPVKNFMESFLKLLPHLHQRQNSQCSR